MSIFVSKDGSQLGPYTPQSLWDALACGSLAGDDTAWVEGGDSISTVGQLVHAPGATPNFIGTGVSSVPENRGIPNPTLRPPAIAPASTAIPTLAAEPPIEYAQPEQPEPFATERLRFIGAATPLVTLLIMLIPWAIDQRFFGHGTFNGYTMFSHMPMPALLFAVAAGGIGLYGFEGANDGGVRGPLLAIGCSLFAICTLAYLTGYRTRSVYTPLFESGEIQLGAGWHITMATVLIGTAGAIIPSSEYEPSAKIGSWIVSGLFGIAGATFIYLGFTAN